MAGMSLYTIRTSNRLRFYLAGLACLASGAVLAADIPWLVRLALLAAILVGGYRSWPRMDEHRLRRDQGRGLELWVGGAWRPVSVRSESVVLPWLCVLHLVLDDGQARTLVILPDGMPADDFRRLRVWLRCKLASASQSGNMV
jgi:toxin CptA